MGKLIGAANNKRRYGRGLRAPIDPFFADVVLLVTGNGANGSTSFTDLSDSAHTVTTNGDAQVSTAVTKFGGGSLAMDGSGDFLSIASTTDFDFTGDFTWEAWVYRTDSAAADAPIFDFRASSAQNGLMYLSPTTRLPSYFNGLLYGDTGDAPTINTWEHCALVRASGVLDFYVGGVSQWSVAMGAAFPASRALRIGSNFAGGSFFNGYFEEMRLTKSYARYTEDFTPPTAPFPTA